MDEHEFNACDISNYELWIAGTVCAAGWFSFLMAFIFLTTSLCLEHGRLKKTQTEIIIFRTSSRNAILEASLLTNAPVSPAAVVNTAYVRSPAPVEATNYQRQPQPFQQMQKPNEERGPDEVVSRIFPNSFSYTATTVPLEPQVSIQSRANSNFNETSPPPVPPKWTSIPQTYPNNR